MRIILCFSIVCLYNFAYCFEHIRPVPYIPSEVSPIKGDDSVGYSIIPNVHKQLFYLNHNNSIIPDLVDNFEVSNNQKKYTFSLKDITFHSGKKLGSEDVVFTIKTALKYKVNNFESLLNIKGALDFITGKSTNISGIKRLSDKKFEVQLEEAYPEFIHALANFRLSIINKDNLSDGLGEFKITKQTSEEIILKKVKNKNRISPTTIVYKKSDKVTAIKKFNLGKYHDLMFFNLTKDEISKLQNAKINEYYFPRTNAFFLNAKVLNRSSREVLSTSLPLEKIMKECLPEKETANVLTPPGFIGHNKNFKKIIKERVLKCDRIERKISILIPNGIGQENCITKILKKKFQSCKKISIEQVEFNKVLKKWGTESAAIYLGYVEAERAVKIYSHFLPEAKFPLGISNNVGLKNLISKLNNENNLIKKSRIAELIDKEILSLNTVIPLSYESLNLITSNKYNRIFMGVRSA